MAPELDLIDPYVDTLGQIFSFSKGRERKRSLSCMETLCNVYNQPQNSFKTIHIAGTNGKGSVSTKIAAALTKGGYRTGLYTSPHISSFRERIQINGQMISKEEIVSLFSDVKKKINDLDLHITFFEITTLLAFLYFRNRGVDVAVIETGLGGRLDATNVISPLLSVITSIGYDHLDLLGPTLEEISREKAGIIKKDVPIVIGPNVSYSFIKKMADVQFSSLYQNTIQGKDYDIENQETAPLALKLLQSSFPLSKKSIEEGLKEKPLCRFEKHVREKVIILDVAHNPQGFERLLERLCDQYPSHHYRFIIGFSKGKDISECAAIIQSKASAVHLVTSCHPCLENTKKIQTAFSSTKTHLYIEESIELGIQHALQASSIIPEVVVVAGSFFIMAEARQAIGIEEEKDVAT